MLYPLYPLFRPPFLVSCLLPLFHPSCLLTILDRQDIHFQGDLKGVLPPATSEIERRQEKVDGTGGTGGGPPAFRQVGGPPRGFKPPHPFLCQ